MKKLNWGFLSVLACAVTILALSSIPLWINSSPNIVSGQVVGDVFIEQANPGARTIYIVRNNTIVGTYGGATNATDLGTALTTAVAALQEGDYLYTGQGEFEVEALALNDDSVTWVANGTVLLPADSAYVSLVNVTADEVVIEGLKCDGKHQTNTSNGGTGILVNNGADRCKLRNITCNNMSGLTAFDGRGIYINGKDCVVDGYRAIDNKYIGIRASNASRLALKNIEIYNSGKTEGTSGADQNTPRSIEIDGSVSGYDYVILENVYCYSNTDKGQAYIGFNTGQTIQHASVTNVKIINEDNYSTGVSYDIANRMQCMKFQNTDMVTLENCTFLHGTNRNSGGTQYSFAFDNAPTRTIMRNCVFSGGYSNSGSGRYEYVRFVNCLFGVDDVNESTQVSGVPPGRISYERCLFNLGTTATSTFLINATAPSDGDFIHITDCSFTSNNGSDTYAFTDEGNEDLLTDARRIICAGNSYANAGAGDFVVADEVNIALMCTTDYNGNIIHDDSDATVADPGVGPTNFFTSLPGVFPGQRIINEEWSASGIQYYVYDGSNWIEGTNF